jgi:hypothetical protein
MQDMMRECGLLYLGWVDGAVQYVPNSLTRENVTQAAAMLADPANDTGTIRAALYELWLITKKEKMLPEDRDAMLMVYARRLAEYPVEVVAVALGAISLKSTFFPAWAEIQTEIDALTGQRNRLLAALRLLLAAHFERKA